MHLQSSLPISDQVLGLHTNYIKPGNCLEIMVESKTFYEEYYYDDDDVVAAVIVTVIHHAL